MSLWDVLENIYESEQKLIYVHSKVPFSKLYVHYKKKNNVNFHKCSEHFWSPSLLLFFSDSKKHTESPCNFKDTQIMPKICFSRVLELSIYAGGCKHSAEYPGDLRESFMLQGWTTSLGGKDQKMVRMCNLYCCFWRPSEHFLLSISFFDTEVFSYSWIWERGLSLEMLTKDVRATSAHPFKINNKKNNNKNTSTKIWLAEPVGPLVHVGRIVVR